MFLEDIQGQSMLEIVLASIMAAVPYLVAGAAGLMVFLVIVRAAASFTAPVFAEAMARRTALAR